jgi:hypothetical protein
MKNISLPNKELRVLSAQLQNFNQGFTVAQIKSLDKVVRIMESVLQPFSEGLDKIIRSVINQVDEKEKAEGEAKKQKELEDFVNTEGEKKVTCTLEDPDFEFVKQVWSRMGNLRGDKDTRELVIKIDNAINGVGEPVFTNHKVELKPLESKVN